MSNKAKSEAQVDLQLVYDIPLTISAVLGRTEMKVNQLVQLTPGSVIELDKKVGEAIDVYVNGRIIARGELVLVDGNKIGVTITEMIKGE